MNRTSAIRAARTSCTAAQNAGRQDTYYEAEKKGIKLRKEWMATLDSRTRHSHAMLDGEIVDNDKKFSNGLMFPGDPNGRPEEVYNCRCTLVAALEGFDGKYRQTYSEWAQRKTDVQQVSTKSSNIANTAVKSKVADLDGLENYFSNKYQGTYFAADIKKLDFKAVNESAEGVDRILDEFPKAKSTFAGFDVSGSGIMSSSYSGMVYFNPKYYGSYQDATRCLVPSETVAGTGMHEAGHLLERALISINGGSGADWNNCTYAKQVVNEAAKAAKKTPEGKGKRTDELRAEVSRYATYYDKSECLAECVEYYMLKGNNAPILAKEVWKILKRELG